jgi:Rrf2 family protein
MLSQTVEYALRAAVYLVEHAPESRTTEEIAKATQVPAAYLSKVLQSLRRSGIVRSQRGLGGGVAMNRDPKSLTILDVVNAVDPLQRIKTCPLGLAAHGKRLCSLHKKMDLALEYVEDMFRSTTLADIIAEPNPSVPLCNVVDIVTDPGKAK